VAAALVSEDVVYMAQAGPGLVYLKHGGRLTRLEPDAAGAEPLGSGNMEPSLRRIELAAGDLVLASSRSLEHIIDSYALAELLERGADEALPELYLLTRDQATFALFVVTCMESDEEATSKPNREEAIEGPVMVSAQAPAPRTPGLAPGVQEPPQATVLKDGRSSIAVADSPQAPVLVSPPPIDISRSVVRLRSEPSASRNEYARTTGQARRLRVNFTDWRLIQVGFVVAVILIMVAFVPDLIRESRSEKLNGLVSSAEIHYLAGQEETDPAQKRLYLEETRRLATEALRIDDTNAVALDLRELATGALQTMNAVFDLGPMTEVAILSRQITGDISITDMSINAGVAYVIDRAGGRVISLPVDGSAPPVVIFQAGETYNGTPSKKPTHIAWEGLDESGRLFILDEERKLFDYRPGSRPVPVPLRRTNTWSSVAGIAGYDGNFYVLDPAGSQVHRYLPSVGGFDSEPAAILSRESSLSDSLGFAVEGDIFVFYKSGKVGRYSNGEPAPFTLGGIDRAISAAIDIAVVSEGDEVFLADSGNKRVVVAGKDGVFRRQLVSNALTDLRAIDVDATGGQLYVVVGDTILSAPVVR
jgi:hypothetical protein